MKQNNKVCESSESYQIINDTPNKITYTEINQKHDKMYRTILSNKKDVAYIINEALNLAKKTKVTPGELEKYKSSFVTNQFKNREADIVYKIKNANIFFLIEHQSKPDYSIPYRIEEYKLEIMKSAIDLKKARTQQYEMPVVIPIVIYTGKAKWNVRKYLEQIKDNRFKEVNLLQYNLIDINKYSNKRLEESDNFIDKIFLLEKAKNADETIKMIKLIIPKLKEQEEKQTLTSIIIAILQRKIGEEKAKEILKVIKKEGTPMLAVLEMIDKENRRIRREGIKEGIEKMIKEMNKNNLSEEQIVKISRLSKEEIHRIINETN